MMTFNSANLGATFTYWFSSGNQIKGIHASKLVNIEHLKKLIPAYASKLVNTAHVRGFFGMKF